MSKIVTVLSDEEDKKGKAVRHIEVEGNYWIEEIMIDKYIARFDSTGRIDIFRTMIEEDKNTGDFLGDPCTKVRMQHISMGDTELLAIVEAYQKWTKG